METADRLDAQVNTPQWTPHPGSGISRHTAHGARRVVVHFVTNDVASSSTNPSISRRANGSERTWSFTSFLAEAWRSPRQLLIMSQQIAPEINAFGSAASGARPLLPLHSEAVTARLDSNPYQLLGVSRDAAEGDVRRAYRRRSSRRIATACWTSWGSAMT